MRVRMRVPSSLAIASAGFSVVLAAGCSGGLSSGSTSAVAPAVAPHLNRTGSRVAFAAARSTMSFPAPIRNAKIAPDLYVSDGAGAIDIFSNKKWTPQGQLTAGLDGNDGDWLDGKGNLYVANYAAANVTEYAPGATSPTFTYSAGLEDATNVSTDAQGDVFVSDFGGGTAGLVNEYAQATNTVKAWCTVPGDVGGAEGVTVDKHGDVFMSYNSSGSGPGQIAEFAHGLKGCKANVLPVSFDYIGDIAFDTKGNMIVCNQGSETVAGAVDILAPPYDKITKQVGTGWRGPFHMSLRKNNKVLIVADPGTDLVTVRKYPSGAVITSLGKGNGIQQALGVADKPEAL